MNDRRLKRLFETARGAPPPEAPEGFDASVLRAIRGLRPEPPFSFWDQIEALSSRLAVAAALVVACCVLADAGYSAAYPGDLSVEAGAISEQWLFAAGAN